LSHVLVVSVTVQSRCTKNFTASKHAAASLGLVSTDGVIPRAGFRGAWLIHIFPEKNWRPF